MTAGEDLGRTAATLHAAVGVLTDITPGAVECSTMPRSRTGTAPIRSSLGLLPPRRCCEMRLLHCSRS